MREMADGKRELTPLPVRREDEVGSLVLGFNYLVARLREKEAVLKASQERMEFMAHHDSLTGLYNRTMLEDRLQQALARAHRNGSRFALLFCDLDCFKPINDKYGHDVGDAVLIEVAARLLARRGQTDTVARLGGDEFVILLTDLDDEVREPFNLFRNMFLGLTRWLHRRPENQVIREHMRAISILTWSSVFVRKWVEPTPRLERAAHMLDGTEGCFIRFRCQERPNS